MPQPAAVLAPVLAGIPVLRLERFNPELGTKILANAESPLLLDFYRILRSMVGDLETEEFVDRLQGF